MKAISDLNLVARYLARRDIAEVSLRGIRDPIDVLVLMPSTLIEPIHIAAGVMKRGFARRLLISGGIGHSTKALRETISSHSLYGSVVTEDRTEADIIQDVLINHHGVPPKLIITENRSTNCGSNAEESRNVLDSRGETLQSLVLVQDPTMQRRSQACFERAWSDQPNRKIISFAPFIPVVHQSGSSLAITVSRESIWPFERFVSLILGEIPRLRDDENGYGPKGQNFIDHVEIPTEILTTHARLAKAYPELVRTVVRRCSSGRRSR
jgi:uncharacterized SAM-binding protein YcdF (DUF218 family)